MPWPMKPRYRIQNRKGEMIMGLIKAALGAAGGVMADQWKEFFYCEAIPSEIGRAHV